MQRPTFTLAAGTLRATTARPVGGPDGFVVERDMDVPADSLRFALRDRSRVAVGDAVALHLGYGGDEKAVFTGAVVAVRPALDGTAVFALGAARALLDLRVAATWRNQAAGSIVGDLVEQAGLAAGTIGVGPVLPRYAVDRRQSAFAHARALADRLGYELYADRAGKIMFHALGADAALDAAGLLGALGSLGAAAVAGGGGESYAFAKHLIGAAATVRPPGWRTVEVGGESPMSGQGDTTGDWLTTKDDDYRGSAGDGAPRLLVLDPAARTKDLADRFAAGRLAVARRRAHPIHLAVLGRPGVDLGDSVTARDAPDALTNGGGYVRALRHRLSSDGGFVTELRLRGGDPS